MDTIETIKMKYQKLKPTFNERTERMWAAAEAIALGWGGITKVSEATGLNRNTISKGIKELNDSTYN